MPELIESIHQNNFIYDRFCVYPILMKNIVLIGFMGTGKTVIGRRLANILGFRFVDVDTIIEKRERKSISEIFQDKGELYFRKLESQIIKEVAGKSDSVITTGGGGSHSSPEHRVTSKGGLDGMFNGDS